MSDAKSDDACDDGGGQNVVAVDDAFGVDASPTGGEIISEEAIADEQQVCSFVRETLCQLSDRVVELSEAKAAELIVDMVHGLVTGMAKEAVRRVESRTKLGLTLASVSSLTGQNEEGDDDVIQVITENAWHQKSTPQKPLIKLASFAGLSNNSVDDEGWHDGDIASGDDEDEADNFLPSCSQCGKKNRENYANTVWETMQYCDETCLEKYQRKWQRCSTCQKDVQNTSMGKYCVRFGSKIKQFCSNICLEDHKKGLKVCCFCQKDLFGGEGFLAPIGDKGQFKDFCAQPCLQRYEELYLGKEPPPVPTVACAVCRQTKRGEVELLRLDDSVRLCSEPCASAYKFANNIKVAKCFTCKRDFDLRRERQVTYVDGSEMQFCDTSCKNVFIMKTRRIVPCGWCKVKKYNFDMIEKWKDGKTCSMFCSIKCFKAYSTLTNSCRGSQTTVVTTSTDRTRATQAGVSGMPVIQSVSSLAGAGDIPQVPDRLPLQPVPKNLLPQDQLPVHTQRIRETIKETTVLPSEPKKMKNRWTLTKPFMQTKGVSCRPHPCHKSTQTEGLANPTIVPVAVPLYVPMPMQMYNAPYPVPVPVPIPVPVPVFIPTTRNSGRGIMKEIKKIQTKTPADPFEAEILAMAGALAEESGKHNNDLESDDSDIDLPALDEPPTVTGATPEGGSSSQQDVLSPLQEMVNSVISDQKLLDDIEKEIHGDRIVPKPLPASSTTSSSGGETSPRMTRGTKRRLSSQTRGDSDEWIPSGSPIWQRHDQQQHHQQQQQQQQQSRSRQRNSSSGRCRSSPRRSSKQARMDISSGNGAVLEVSQQPKERPDAKNHLKFTYGVNAWKHWVVQKNAQLEREREQGKYTKPFETDLLKLRADELSFTLCLFIKEARKPNGDLYAPDSVLYLALGIQEYLFENGRIDNIFTDAYYDAFTSALHDVVKDFKLPVNEFGYFVTRIEEEHLWEAKQLGAHSPQVLLNTLVFFNTKYFMLKTVEDHHNLSFSHVMKHWQKAGGTTIPAYTRGTNSANPPAGTQSVLLRYCPPLSPSGQARSKTSERKFYEQQENRENPLRCPVKLYEFYLSKCPECMKTRSDHFYLQPERSCIPDSPVWYSSSPLDRHQLDKMLQRLLMVREVQEHMLAADTQQ